MKLHKIDPAKIQIPEVRVTARFDEDSARQFEASVETAGIDEPIKVYKVGDQFILSDGLHRLQQALRLKLPTIEAYVRDGTMEEVLCNNLMSGHLRGKHPPSEMVKVIEALWKEYKWDSEKIAEKTGLTRDYVEKLQLISELTPLGREALDDQRLKVGHALALVKVKDPVKQEAVLHQQLLYKWSVKELEQYVVDVNAIIEQPAVASTTAAIQGPMKVKCNYCGDDYELHDVANPNTCKFCSGILFTAMSQSKQEAAAAEKAAAAAAPAAQEETKN